MCLSHLGCVTALGFGASEERLNSNYLKSVDIPIIRHSNCKQWTESVNLPNPSRKQVCAGGMKGKDSCHGDSGGALLFKDVNSIATIYGVTSWGAENCGEENSPAVYVRVTEYLKWIFDTTGVYRQGGVLDSLEYCVGRSESIEQKNFCIENFGQNSKDTTTTEKPVFSMKPVFPDSVIEDPEEIPSISKRINFKLNIWFLLILINNIF